MVAGTRGGMSRSHEDFPRDRDGANGETGAPGPPLVQPAAGAPCSPDCASARAGSFRVQCCMPLTDQMLNGAHGSMPSFRLSSLCRG